MSDDIEKLFEEHEEKNLKRSREERDREVRGYSRSEPPRRDRDEYNEYNRRDRYDRGNDFGRDRSNPEDRERERKYPRQVNEERPPNGNGFRIRYDSFRKEAVGENQYNAPPKKNNSYPVMNKMEEYPTKRQKTGNQRMMLLPSTLPTSETIKQTPESTQSQRTVFVYRLNSIAREEEVRNFFERAGMVRDVKLIKDKFTGMSKGFGYIEFHNQASVAAALAMHGQSLLGSPVCVKQLQVDTQAQTQVKVNKAKKQVTKLYVTNFPNILDEEDMDMLFGSIGSVDSIEMKESQNKSKYCYVTYKRPHDAPKALLRINGADLGLGSSIRVGMWNEELAKTDGKSKVQLETLDGGSRGIKLTSDTRSNLMRKIAGGAMKEIQDDKQLSREKDEKKKERRTMAVVPTKNIILKNMFDSTRENDFEEIYDDVKRVLEEYGKLVNIFIDERSKDGEIYLRYKSISEASRARENVKDRTFDKKKIDVIFIEDSQFFEAMERVRKE